MQELVVRDTVFTVRWFVDTVVNQDSICDLTQMQGLLMLQQVAVYTVTTGNLKAKPSGFLFVCCKGISFR